MFLFSSLISLNNKLVAYSFGNDSGINTMAQKTGFVGTLSDTPTNIAGLVISILLSLLGVVFLGLVIYGGTQWLLAEGDESKVEKAKKILAQSTMGLAIVLAAYAVSFFVINALSNQTLK